MTTKLLSWGHRIKDDVWVGSLNGVELFEIYYCSIGYGRWVLISKLPIGESVHKSQELAMEVAETSVREWLGQIFKQFGPT